MIIYIGISCMSTLAYTWLTRIAIAVTTDDGRYLLMWVSINSTAIAIDCYWMKQMFIWIDQFATIVRRLRRELRRFRFPVVHRFSTCFVMILKFCLAETLFVWKYVLSSRMKAHCRSLNPAKRDAIELWIKISQVIKLMGKPQFGNKTTTKPKESV